MDQVLGMARVMEDYAMQETGEISLHRGGIINVYEIIDQEWSRGELNGKIGRYPSKVSIIVAQSFFYLFIHAMGIVC